MSHDVVENELFVKDPSDSIRHTSVKLLSSPQWGFPVLGHEPTGHTIHSVGRATRRCKYFTLVGLIRAFQRNFSRTSSRSCSFDIAFEVNRSGCIRSATLEIGLETTLREGCALIGWPFAVNAQTCKQTVQPRTVQSTPWHFQKKFGNYHCMLASVRYATSTKKKCIALPCVSNNYGN